MFESTNIFLLGTATAAVAGLVYVLYGPSQNAPRARRRYNDSNGKLSGLVNYGNHCFVNTVLQSLASCKSVIDWLQYSIDSSHEPKQARKTYAHFVPHRKSTQQLTSSLLNTLKSLNTSSDGDLPTPLKVLKALETHRWLIPNEEQDAHELFNVLTSTLETEFYSSLPAYSLQDALLIKDILESPTSSCPVSIEGVRNRSAFDLSSVAPYIPKSIPTRGLLASQLLCTTCGYKYPVRMDMFDSISLAIPVSVLGAPVLLQECLNKFVRCEVLQEVSCEGCSTSGSKTSVAKKLTFAKLPQLLCFHVQRLVWLNNGMLMKRSEHVVFPEYLCLDEYVYMGRKPKSSHVNPSLGLVGGKVEKPLGTLNNESITSLVGDVLTESGSTNLIVPKYRYRLNAVIVHLGDALSGHFITYRRGGAPDDSNSWYYTSDANVRSVSLRDVLASTAYMVFYERIKI